MKIKITQCNNPWGPRVCTICTVRRAFFLAAAIGLVVLLAAWATGCRSATEPSSDQPGISRPDSIGGGLCDTAGCP